MSKNNLYFPIILGTARKGRQSEEAARFMLEQVLKKGFSSEIIDVRDYRRPATDRSGNQPRQKS